MTTFKELSAVNKKLREIQKYVEKGSRPVPQVLAAPQAIIEGRFPQPADSFQHLLSSLDEQKRRLAEAGVSEGVFDCVNMTEPEEQRVDCYTILFYVPDGTYAKGNPTSTLEFYLQMMSQELKVYRWLEPTETKLRLRQRCERYSEGVHRVVVDLTANWGPKNGRSMRQVFSQDGESLAGAEGFAAYTLSPPELIQCQDGEKLPYCDTGIERQFDDGWSRAVCFRWARGPRRVNLSSYHVGSVRQGWSAPGVSRES